MRRSKRTAAQDRPARRSRCSYARTFIRRANRAAAPLPSRSKLPGSGTAGGGGGGGGRLVPTLSLPPSLKPRKRTSSHSPSPPPVESALMKSVSVSVPSPAPANENVNVAEPPTPIPGFGLPPPNHESVTDAPISASPNGLTEMSFRKSARPAPPMTPKSGLVETNVAFVMRLPGLLNASAVMNPPLATGDVFVSVISSMNASGSYQWIR